MIVCKEEKACPSCDENFRCAVPSAADKEGSERDNFHQNPSSSSLCCSPTTSRCTGCGTCSYAERSMFVVLRVVAHVHVVCYYPTIACSRVQLSMAWKQLFSLWET